MKKATSIFLLITFILLLCSCGAVKPEIEDCEWKMRTIVHIQDGEAAYDASAEEIDGHPEAKIVEMTLVAKDGKITINDITNDKKYEGSYIVSGRNPKGTDYHITIDGKSGYATVAMTTYTDGTEEATLPISIGGYSMYFYAK